MSLSVEQAREELETIQSLDPLEMREKTLETLIEVVDADEGAFTKYALHNGEYYYTGVRCVAAEDFRDEVLPEIEGKPTLADMIWDPQLPPADERQCFVRKHYDPQQLRETTELRLLRLMYGRFDINTQLRALLYDGPRFLGWMGCWRRNGEQFTEEEEDRLNRLVDSVVTVLTVAERAESRAFTAPAQLLVGPDGVRIDCATPGGNDWLTTDRRSHIAELIRRAEAGAPLPPAVLVDGYELRLTRMYGDQGARYLACVTSLELPKLSVTAALTPRQREIAEYAAVGATAAEIADTLDISFETVRHHIKNIYTRLNICSRTELAMRLGEVG